MKFLIYFVLLLTLLSEFAFAASSRVIDADTIKSSDHTKVWTMPGATGTVSTTGNAETLTNKSISGSSNTLTNLPASGLSGQVPIANGGTGQATAGPAFNALSPITSTGDLIIGNGANSATRLGIGTNTQVLTSNGTTATWAAAGGGLSAWATSVSYTVGNVVTYGATAYYCLVNHTSGTFETDLQSGDWKLLDQPTVNQNLMAVGYNFEDNDAGGWTAVNANGLTNGLPSAVGTSGNAFSSSNGGTTKGANTTAAAVTSSGPINGSYSLNLATSGAGTIGDGYISQAYNVPIAFQAKALTLKFKYKSASGAPVMSGTSSNTYAAAVYDVTNNAWLGLAGAFNFVQSSGVGDFIGTFQTASNTAKVQVFIYSPVAPVGASSLLLDEFYLGQQATPMGPAMSDMTAYTATLSNLGNATAVTYWGRHGDLMHLKGRVTIGSSLPTGTLSVSIPSFASVDTSKTAGGLGSVAATHTNTTTGIVFLSGNNLNFYGGGVNVTNVWNSTVPFTFAAGDLVDFDLYLPVTGWSSNTAMSSDTDTRVVAFNASGTTTSVTNSFAVMKFPTTTYDTHSGYSSSSGLYTCPVAGFYRVTGVWEANGISLTTAQTIQTKIYKNGSDSGITPTVIYGTGGGALYYSVPITGTIQCNAGDTIGIYAYSSVAGTATAGTFEAQRLSGPAVVSATESVGAALNGASATLTGSLSNITWLNKENDSHGGWNGNTTYTIPVSGRYSINVQLYFGQASSALNNAIYVAILKNGSIIRESGYVYYANTTVAPTFKIDTIATSFNAGDTITVQASSSATTPVITASTIANYFQIKRDGN